MACRTCLTRFIMEKVEANMPSKIVCTHPGCGKPFTPADYRSLLSGEQHDLYENSTLTEFVSTNSSTLVTCPQCKSVVERISGGSASKDPVPSNSPVPMVPETIAHYNHCRFKCRECDTEFCSDCATSPYHLGFTCASFKSFKTSAHCRFCDVQLKPTNTAPPMKYGANLRDVCTNPECIERRGYSCAESLKCGHACGGIIQDSLHSHLPCLKCPQPDGSAAIGGDWCPICYSEGLSNAPCIKLACSHILHYHCAVSSIKAKWPGMAITFRFLECPICKQEVSHPALKMLLAPHLEMKEKIQQKALERFNHMNLKEVKELTDKDSPYFNNPLKYSLARFCYYPCFTCKEPYFGGLKDCNAELAAAGKEDKLEELICGPCAAKNAGDRSSCAKHGTDYIEYKCKFCCNVAAWYCWGSTHFCEECHKKAADVAKLPKNKLPKCTCKGNHPPNGEEYCLGCSVCRFTEDF